MLMQRQIWIWVGLLVGALFLLWLFRGILTPFLVGMALAYLLDPVADLLERWKFSRFWATSVVMAVVVVLVIGAFFLVVPLIVQQAIGLAQRLPGYINQLQELANQWAPEIREFLGEDRAQQFENGLSDLLDNSFAIIGGITSTAFQSSLTIINTLGLLVVTPVVAFYLLLDWDGMTKRIDDLLPRDYASEIRGVLSDMDKALAGFIRGQGSVVLLLAIFYAVALSLAGLNFGLAIGVTAGLLSFVPYVGFLVGAVLSIGIAIVQSWPDWLYVGLIAGIFLVGQFIEGNILYPKLVGSSIGVHPVWLMFSLFAVGILFGTVGLLLAVPIVAIIGVLVRFAIRKYKQGPLYLGSTQPLITSDQEIND